MQDFLKRVINEREELNNRLVKLNKFLSSDIFSRLSTEEQSLLEKQSETMEVYLSILDKRINYYRNKEN